jgi:hypothetical protein
MARHSRPGESARARSPTPNPIVATSGGAGATPAVAGWSTPTHAAVVSTRLATEASGIRRPRRLDATSTAAGT